MLPSRQPHIAFVLADDFAHEMWPTNGHEAMQALMPTLSQYVMHDGLELSRVYAYKLCAPARASLLSGRWPHRAYDTSSMRACKGVSPGMTNLAEKLRDEGGYTCHFVGKVRALYPHRLRAHPNHHERPSPHHVSLF